MRRTIQELTARLEKFVREKQLPESTVRERHRIEMVSRYRSELDTLTLRLQVTENELKRLRSHPVDSAES